MKYIPTSSSDLLAAYSPGRQARIINDHIVDSTFVKSRLAGGLQLYRSPEEIRYALADELARRPGPCALRKSLLPPPSPPRDAARQRIYKILTNKFGTLCMLCGVNLAREIDHDHFTGLVRGFTCKDCNSRVDKCAHPSSLDCPFSAYLAFPPALSLGIKYPPSKPNTSAVHKIRIEILGFDPMDRRLWPRPLPSDWVWIAPPPNALRHYTDEARALRSKGARPSGAPCSGSKNIRAQGITDEVVPRESYFGGR